MRIGFSYPARRDAPILDHEVKSLESVRAEDDYARARVKTVCAAQLARS